jgi:hypothetical protein
MAMPQTGQLRIGGRVRVVNFQSTENKKQFDETRQIPPRWN